MAILFIGGFENSLIMKDYHCCIDWLEEVIWVLDKRATVDLTTTLSNSWNNRNNNNNFISCGKEEEVHVVWERARTFSQDFRIFNLINDPLLPTNPSVKRGFKNEMMSVEWAEIYAFEGNIKMVCTLNIKTVVVFEIGNASFVNIVKHHSTDVTIVGEQVK
ncbi:hypothetical protein PVK06_005647 [Gossypium arboreum]|uniref:Uncharacterized protein n=1 Tax=Gossypium arboreum TaxID=29729 RepID=A0ABR0QW46_GOSAR|nr:hypothetical protein PVK06_005647 [Gossypium arboreum]